ALQSLIAARFSPQERAGAMSVMSGGYYLGLLVGLALGGALIESLGWRSAFLIMGASGIILAPVIWMTLRDPTRLLPATNDTVVNELSAILRAPGIQHFLAVFCLMGLTTSGTVAWAPAFYARYYGMSPAQ